MYVCICVYTYVYIYIHIHYIYIYVYVCSPYYLDDTIMNYNLNDG